jgi:ribose/xylose/arabinose/galactoside ABC-type transport system permease subunit
MSTLKDRELVSTDEGLPAVIAASVARKPSLTVRMGPYWAIMAWALSLVVFSILSPNTFATGDNLRAVLGEQSLLAIAAIAVTIPMICGHFDLSIGANISLTGLVTAGMMAKSDLPWELAVVIGLCLGIVIGAVNGVLVAHFAVHSFIATLGVSTILQGLALWYGGGQILYRGISPSFLDISQTRLLGIPITVLYLLVIVIAIWFVLARTPFGRYLYAIGSNRSAAAIAGVRVKRHSALSLILCGALAGLAGVLLASRSGSAQANAGLDYLLPAFAAAFIGAATFRRGQFNAFGTVVGVYFVATLVSGAFILGGANYVSSLISGAALIVAVIGNRAIGDRFGG